MCGLKFREATRTVHIGTSSIPAGSATSRRGQREIELKPFDSLQNQLVEMIKAENTSCSEIAMQLSGCIHFSSDGSANIGSQHFVTRKKKSSERTSWLP